ncbi:Nitrilase [Halocaridina rubra]|uniref:Nitrilase and fragile histidine triad fusion protein NitFhit n=1 Tax=Halocaridina rubra TaxID=373956 RepID=A0AAN9A1U2_HALRR
MKTLAHHLFHFRYYLNCKKSLLPLLQRLPQRSMSQNAAEAHMCRVAVVQMTSVSDKEVNFHTCEDFIKKAVAAGAKMVFLPEACDYIAETKEDSIKLAESIQGPIVLKYCNLGASLGVWLSLGGLHIKEKEENKVSNTHILTNEIGEIVSTYKKTHLFSVHIPEKNLRLEESTYISQGEGIYDPVSTPAGNVALAICYDMRFPELSLIQRRLGAQILTYPSAFTVTTGLAHWKTILRARAIETQCYVIAAAQTGQHNKKRSSYGHAMIVDPWGTVLCEIKEGTGFAVADIDLTYLNKIRQEMPVVAHRRSDLYYLNEIPLPKGPRICQILPMPSPYASYQFGQVTIPGSCIFLKSVHSQAFVNKKPVVPGHILLTPEKPVKRLCDMSSAEVCDSIQLIQIASVVVIKKYNPESIQIVIQDGPAAGQTIEHVHFHLVPLNEDSRQKLQGHENHGAWREKSEMEKEAQSLQHIVNQVIPTLLKKPFVSFTSFELVTPTLQDPVSIEYDHLNIPDECLIAKTKQSCAFIPPNPALTGHICVTPLQNTADITEVAADVLTDLFLNVQLVQRHAESVCKTGSSTIVLIQDHLLQKSTQQLQVHILPRVEGDLPDNDDIYKVVKNFDLRSSDWSVMSEVSSIASQIRSLIYV